MWTVNCYDLASIVNSYNNNGNAEQRNAQSGNGKKYVQEHSHYCGMNAMNHSGTAAPGIVYLWDTLLESLKHSLSLMDVGLSISYSNKVFIPCAQQRTVQQKKSLTKEKEFFIVVVVVAAAYGSFVLSFVRSFDGFEIFCFILFYVFSSHGRNRKMKWK